MSYTFSQKTHVAQYPVDEILKYNHVLDFSTAGW